MKAGVIVFPGSNCDRDVKTALSDLGFDASFIWHKENEIPQGLDLVVLPGGFSYGDYLRCGAMSANSNIMKSVIEHANKGGKVLGICNGFQILTESGLLPGALLRNRDIKFICKDVYLKPENTSTEFTKNFTGVDAAKISVAHHDGNYFIESDGVKSLNDNGQVAFRYSDENGVVSDATNPNGSIENIAGIFSENKNILGMMPHPERHCDEDTGGIDGKFLFESLLG